MEGQSSHAAASDVLAAVTEAEADFAKGVLRKVCQRVALRPPTVAGQMGLGRFLCMELTNEGSVGHLLHALFKALCHGRHHNLSSLGMVMERLPKISSRELIRWGMEHNGNVPAKWWPGEQVGAKKKPKLPVT